MIMITINYYMQRKRVRSSENGNDEKMERKGSLDLFLLFFPTKIVLKVADSGINTKKCTVKNFKNCYNYKL